MKLRNLFLCAFAAAATLVGCNKENGEEQTGSLDITLSTETLEFEAAKSTKTVEVTAGREWKATYDEPEGGAWFSISPESAKGNQIVEIGVSENTGYDRSAEIKFSNGLKNKTLKITQKGTSAFNTIAEVRAMYQGSAVNVADGIKVKGVVISNKDLNNLTSTKSLYVQDATAGINVFCSAAHSFAFGDEVVFDLSGAELTEFSGLIEINNYDASKAEKVGTATPEAKTVSVDDFLDDKYQGQYIAIEKCQVAQSDLSKNWKGQSITVENESGKSFVVYASSYATSLDKQVSQGSGTICGIASNYKSTIQLYFAQESDFAGMTGARFEGPEASEMAIADVFTTTETAAKVKGSVVAAGTKSIVINDGGDKNLYVYINAEHSWKVGDAVVVEGTISKYGKTGTGYTQLIQISEPTISTYSGTITPKSETAAVLTSTDIDAPYSNASSPKIKVNAIVKVSVSGTNTYKNLDFGGTVQGAVIASSLDAEFTDGRALEITGYYAGVNTGGYISILPVEVKASSASFFGVSDQSLSVAASATSATFKVTGNVAWTASSSNANFTVSPASGNGEADVTVTFPANTNTENEVTANITVSTTANVATKSYTVAITQAKAPGADTKIYTKVTSNLTDWSGTYLIVNESTNQYLNGSLEVGTSAGQMGSTAGMVDVTISEGKIVGNETVDAAVFTFEKSGDGYAIKSATKYIGQSTNNNGLKSSDSASTYVHSLSVNEDGTVNILSSDEYTKLAYNKSSKFIRYYKVTTISSQPTSYPLVSLYKLN